MSGIYPSDLVDAKGNVYPTVGENIRRGFNDSSTPQPEPPTKKEFGTILITPLIIDFKNNMVLKEDGTPYTANEYGIDFERHYLYPRYPGRICIGILGIDWGLPKRFGNYPTRYAQYAYTPCIDLSKIYAYNWTTGTFKIYILEIEGSEF